MSRKANILVVDDEPFFYNDLQMRFKKFYNLNTVRSKMSALQAIRAFQVDLVLLDLILDKTITDKRKAAEEGGLEVIKIIKQYKPKTPIIVVTKHNETKFVVEAMKLGAEDFFWKEEIDTEKWKHSIDKILKKQSTQAIQSAKDKTSANQSQNETRPPGNKSESKTTTTSSGKKTKLPPQNKPKSKTSALTLSNKKPFIGKSLAVEQLKKVLEKLSTKPNVTVLLTGETGVGKEVAAKYLHTSGVRQDKPFIAVNLVTITKEISESRLFGHKKGSFTGATDDRIGLFEQADGGILFLDEIGEISLDLQVKLLRFLQEKVITPIGKQDVLLDVQIVAATNKNLEEEVAAGKFREDLYYRLNQFPIEIPPLRERREDIKTLLDFYLQKEKESFDILTESAKSYLLEEYSWPGNIRELVNWTQSACLKREMLEASKIDRSLCPKNVLEVKHAVSINNLVQNNILTSNMAAGNSLADVSKLSYQEKAAYDQLKPVENAFKEYGNKSKVIEALKIKSLDNLRYKVKKYFKKHPHIFEHFPILKAKYNLKNEET